METLHRQSRHAGALAVGLLAALAVAPLGAPRAAQALAPAGGVSLGDSLRLDPAVRTGVLPNGLRYYVRHNGRPEARVSLRLVVAVGSTAEQEDQRGLAHFCEHMDFNGSAHFRPEELVAYLEAIGLRFGADANAYTSYDETVYMLEVPTDRDTLLDRGLLALSDFAGGATLSDEEIRKERGVVLEEWRLGRGAEERVLRKQHPVLFQGSRYADRLVIGLPEIIEHAPVERLRDFYRTWYTPDRMAVVAVGDVDPARMDSLIRVHFGDLRWPARSPPRPLFDIPLRRETLVSVATDKELTYSSVTLYFRRPLHPTRTVSDFRNDLVERLYTAMFNARLAEIAHRADTPFLRANAFTTTFGRTLAGWGMFAVAQDGRAGDALASLLEETARVRQHGFLPGELARAKEQVRAADERAWAERDKSESPGFAAAYVNGFLRDVPVPGMATRHRLIQALLDGITLEEVNARRARLMPEAGRVVLASAPDRPGVTAPSEAELRAIVVRAGRAPLSAWVDSLAGKALMATPPAPGRVVARRTLDEIGVTVLTLSNGVEVWLKPTDFKDDEILLGAQAPGGASLADSADYVTAEFSATTVGRCGVGGFTVPDLQKLLAGRIASAGTYVGDYMQGLSGAARPADLEAALQLAHLDFTHLTVDTASFTAMQRGFRTTLVERGNSPEGPFQDTLSAVNSGGFYMDRYPTVAELDSVRLGDALAFHRRLFANAADFTFFVVGSFQVDSIVPLLERYLGSLPSTGRRTSSYRALGPRYPDGVRRVVVRKGVEPKSRSQITFFVNDGLEELDLYRARTCASILTEHLRQTLRETMGGTYSATAALSYLSPLPGYATMAVRFGCDPARVDTLVVAALAEVRRLREEGPAATDLQREQEIQHRELETALRDNGYWLGSLQTVNALGWDPRRIAKRGERIDGLTPSDLRETFRKYFPLDRYSVVTLLPAPAGAQDGR
jgi:zinc protease